MIVPYSDSFYNNKGRIVNSETPRMQGSLLRASLMTVGSDLVMVCPTFTSKPAYEPTGESMGGFSAARFDLSVLFVASNLMQHRFVTVLR